MSMHDDDARQTSVDELVNSFGNNHHDNHLSSMNGGEGNESPAGIIDQWLLSQYDSIQFDMHSPQSTPGSAPGILSILPGLRLGPNNLPSEFHEELSGIHIPRVDTELIHENKTASLITPTIIHSTTVNTNTLLKVWLPHILTGFDTLLVESFIDKLCEVEGILTVGDLMVLRDEDYFTLERLGPTIGFKMGHFLRVKKALLTII